MDVKFWGVRGSIPTPLTPEKVRRKIAAVVQRITPEDLVSADTREFFLSQLPPELFGTVGGNTTCIEVRLNDDTLVIFDAGSGLRELGAELKKQRKHIREYHIFFTHFHWDHIQGLPFFAPQLFDPRCTVHFYGLPKNYKALLEKQMDSAFFPVSMQDTAARLCFHHLDQTPVRLGNAKISWREVSHPGRAVSYRIQEGARSMIFSTDTELSDKDFISNDENRKFYENCDLIILDSQYTLDEAIEKYNWGHSSYSLAVDFSLAWKIKNLVLFHHEPMYADKKLYSIFKSAGWYLQHMNEASDLNILLAEEGLSITI